MINDEASNGYHFAVKHLSELKSLGWLMDKNDALNYQNIETHQERISKLKPVLISIIGKGKNFQ